MQRPSPARILSFDAERWQSGRMHRIRNPAYSFNCTEGSNPSFSATDWFPDFPRSPQDHPQAPYSGAFVFLDIPTAPAQPAPSWSTSRTQTKENPLHSRAARGFFSGDSAPQGCSAVVGQQAEAFAAHAVRHHEFLFRFGNLVQTHLKAAL